MLLINWEIWQQKMHLKILYELGIMYFSKDRVV